MERVIRVIHLDDVQEESQIVEHVLRKSGLKYDFHWVPSREKYCAALKELSPDIVLSDHSMPGFTSVDAFRLLKNSHLDIPFILLTATVSEEFAVMMMKEGIDDYVLKDRLHRLPIAMENALEQRQAEKEAEEQRVASEYSLRLSQANLSAIMDNSNIHIYSLDSSFRYITFNSLLASSVKGAYGLDIKVGDVVFEFLNRMDPNQASWWNDVYVEVLKGTTKQFIKQFTFGDVVVYMSFSLNPIRDEHSITGIVCFAMDVTAQREAELQQTRMTRDIIQRNKDLEQFAYIVSHNLRGPVANILGIANILQYQGLQPKDRTEALSGIAVATHKLDDVITDLNQILQTKQEVNVKKEPVVFQDVVDSITLSIDGTIKKNRVQVVTDFARGESISTIRGYLHSIFYNLISNSIKYRQLDVDPVIRISSRPYDDGVRLEFADNGIGIDLNTQGSKVFGLYKRFHPNHAEGKGMGLFMVKTQVETLGGEISVLSEVGKGTVFTIDL